MLSTNFVQLADIPEKLLKKNKPAALTAVFWSKLVKNTLDLGELISDLEQEHPDREILNQIVQLDQDNQPPPPTAKQLQIFQDALFQWVCEELSRPEKVRDTRLMAVQYFPCRNLTAAAIKAGFWELYIPLGYCTLTTPECVWFDNNYSQFRHSLSLT
jgi:hypothetical protein